MTTPNPGLFPGAERLALAALLLPLIGALGSRWEIFNYSSGLLLVVLGGLLALVIALIAAIRFLTGYRGNTATWRGVAPALPTLVLVLSLAASGQDYPVTHDISTDRQNPPRFTAAVALRGESSNPLDFSVEKAERQQQGYPDLHGLNLALPPEQLWPQALDAARDLGWDIHYQAPQLGVFEAVATTFWFGFKDDVVVRIHADPQGGSVVDVRSTSRVGKGDLGANAKRIRAFFALLSPAD